MDEHTPREDDDRAESTNEEDIVGTANDEEFDETEDDEDEDVDDELDADAERDL